MVLSVDVVDAALAADPKYATTWLRDDTGTHHMGDDLKYQLRLTLNDGFAQTARSNPADASIAGLTDILRRHDRP